MLARLILAYAFAPSAPVTACPGANELLTPHMVTAIASIKQCHIFKRSTEPSLSVFTLLFALPHRHHGDDMQNSKLQHGVTEYNAARVCDDNYCRYSGSRKVNDVGTPIVQNLPLPLPSASLFQCACSVLF